MSHEANPRLPSLERGALLVTLVALVLGVSLLVPSLSIPRWPWEIPPFNARFIGMIYLAGWVGTCCSFVVGRRSPAIGFTRAAAVFTAVATLASLLHRDAFLPDRPLAVAVWWLAYIGFFISLTVITRRLAALPAIGQPPSAGRRRRYGGYAALTAAYGLAMFLVPTQATAFWPWPVDAFHARVYSGIFLSGSALLIGLRGVHRPADLAMAGLLQAVFGLGAVWGTWSVNRTVQRIDWGASGSLVWLLIFGGVGFAGLVMLIQALRQRGHDA